MDDGGESGDGAVAASACPGGGDPQHAVLVAVCAWDLGGDLAMVLETVPMPPGEFGEVVGFTGLAEDRAGKSLLGSTATSK